MSSKTPLIGLTGGIGAGKTTVARIFERLHIPIYYADDRAKWLTANDPDIRTKVKTLFGAEAFDEAGQLNRSHLSKEIFGSPEKAKELESWVHPAVKEDFESWASAQVKQAAPPYLIKEAALLFEAKSYQDLDAIVVVTAPNELRIQRVLKRDPHRDQAQVEAILAKQLPQGIKQAHADFVIQNDGNQHLITQVLRIHEQLVKLKANQ